MGINKHCYGIVIIIVIIAASAAVFVIIIVGHVLIIIILSPPSPKLLRSLLFIAVHCRGSSLLKNFRISSNHCSYRHN